jgi:hypothetical protein
MIGLRGDQRGIFEANHLYVDYVGKDSFYGFPASSLAEFTGYARELCHSGF